MLRPNDWREYPEGGFQLNRTTAFLRSEGRVKLYLNGMFERAFDGDCEVFYLGDVHIEVKGKPKVYYQLAAKDQSIERPSAEVFTTLDRPAPLSPEMLAMQRMIRKNEIERERQRDEIDRKIEAAIRPRGNTGGQHSVAPAETSGKAKEDTAEDVSRGAAGDERHSRQSDNADFDAVVDDEPKDSGGQSGSSSDAGRSQGKPSAGNRRDTASG